jgi:hypothetical protein
VPGEASAFLKKLSARKHFHQICFKGWMIMSIDIIESLVFRTLTPPTFVINKKQADVKSVKQSAEKVSEQLTKDVNVTQMQPGQCSNFSAITDARPVDSNPLR